MSDVVIEQRITATDDFTGENGGSTGTITTVAGALLVNGERFFLDDGFGAEVTYQFNDPSVAPPPPATKVFRIVPFTAADTADQVRDAVIAAVRVTEALNILASNGGASTINLTNRLPGLEGNVTPTADTVVNAGFVVSSMSGGRAATPSVVANGVRVYDPANFGGLVDFDWLLPKVIGGLTIQSQALTWIVERLVVEATGATSLDIDIVLPDETVISLSTGGGALVTLEDIKLAGDERLRVTTTGGTLAMFLRATGRPVLHVPA